MSRWRGAVRAAGLALAGGLSAAAVLNNPTAAAQGSGAAGQTLAADLAALTAEPHRLAGTAEGGRAAEYVAQRLRAMGVETVGVVRELGFPVVQLGEPTQAVTLEIGGVSVGLSPVGPNVVVPTRVDGELRGPRVYGGRGTREELGDRDLSGAVVFLEMDCGPRWGRVFARGAAAVVFLGDRTTGFSEPASTAVPWNLPRYWVSGEAVAAAAAAGVDLRGGQPRTESGGNPGNKPGADLAVDPGEARLVAEALPREAAGPGWVRQGRNVVAVIRGTDPAGRDGNREAVVVSARLDTWGVVPTRTRGTRRAANVAGLLALAEDWVRRPPRRDVWLFFLDDGAHRHRGARVLYDSLYLSDKGHEAITEEHSQEAAQVAAALAALGRVEQRVDGATVQADADRAGDETLRDRLKLEADWARADAGDKAARAAWDRVRRALHERVPLETLGEADAAAVTDLIRRTRHGLEARAVELDVERQRDAERAALRRAVKGGDAALPEVVLHVSLDLSDGAAAGERRADDGPADGNRNGGEVAKNPGAVWAPVAGEWTGRVFGLREPRPGADAPGYHQRVLGVFAEVAETLDPAQTARLERAALRDLRLAESLVPGRYVNSGAVAGSYGRYHVALMTGYDVRPGDGQPVEGEFRLAGYAAQWAEAGAVLRGVVDSPGLSLPSAFGGIVLSKRPGWDGRRPTGSFVSRRVTGGLSENRPAGVGAEPGDGEAVVAIWPGDKGQPATAWSVLAQPRPLDYLPMDLAPVNRHGRFALTALRQDYDDQVALLATELGPHGRPTTATTQATLVQVASAAIRVDTFAARGYGLMWWGAADRAGEAGGPGGEIAGQRPGGGVLRASSDGAYRPNRSLIGRAGPAKFWMLEARAGETPSAVKVFDPHGPVLLGIDGPGDAGGGVEAERFEAAEAWGERSAADLWRLNETRLSALRTRGVTSPDLEVLHAEAGRVMREGARSESLRSLALSQEVYPRLRAAMDDLVYAIVVLLLLTIPFAFAVERLVVGAAGVYGRIAGFTAAFMATFALMYATHPGFAVAATPVMIFLAFAIVLLSAAVTWLLVRRFRDELREIQTAAGPGTDRTVGGAASAADGQHEAKTDGPTAAGRAAGGNYGDTPGTAAGGVSGGTSRGASGGTSGGGVALAAIGMGVSTMRRRPTRTVLTAGTVMMLTFTVLCFANVDRAVGVRSVGLGPTTEAMPSRAVLVRRLDTGPLALGTLEVLREPGRWAQGWWRVPAAGDWAGDDRPITAARADGSAAVRLGAVMGVDPGLGEAWPGWARVLRPAVFAESMVGELLESGGVFLPEETVAQLGLDPGDTVRVDGRAMWLAGTVDGAALTRLRQVDGEPWRPTDVAAQAALGGEGSSRGPRSGGRAPGNGGGTIRLSAGRVAVASNRAVERMGGTLRSLTWFAGQDEDPAAVGAELAAVLPTPVWVTGPGGAARLTLGPVTTVSGVGRVVAPVLLGGLIIFGTLLGSISDRQREIYTFSALGLGPKHGGLLFFAEAAVYA
ncbi:MAG: hypothetical protein AAGG38_13790, partial [Planctomycetota bacterium]